MIAQRARQPRALWRITRSGGCPQDAIATSSRAKKCHQHHHTARQELQTRNKTYPRSTERRVAERKRVRRRRTFSRRTRCLDLCSGCDSSKRFMTGIGIHMPAEHATNTASSTRSLDFCDREATTSGEREFLAYTRHDTTFSVLPLTRTKKQYLGLSLAMYWRATVQT